MGWVVRESVSLVAIACGRPVRIRVRPAITVGVSTAKAVKLRIAPNRWAAIRSVTHLVVANPVTVGVKPLGAIKWENVWVVCGNLEQSRPFWSAEIIPRCVLIIVAIPVAISVVPLRCIIWECITRLVHVKLSAAEIEVVIVTVPIAIGVGPLQGVSRVEVAFVRPTVAVSVWASKAVLGRSACNRNTSVWLVGRPWRGGRVGIIVPDCVVAIAIAITVVPLRRF